MDSRKASVASDVIKGRSQRTIGVVRGSAKIKVLTDPMPLFYEEGEHPAVAYGRYAERMVRDIMDRHQQLPTEITVVMSHDGDE